MEMLGKFKLLALFFFVAVVWTQMKTGVSAQTTADNIVSSPTPDSGTTAPTPDSGTTAPTPDSGTTVPTPDSGTTVPTPDSDTTAPTPDSDTTVPTPDSDTTAPTPDSGTTVPTPDSGTTAPTPDSGTTPTPDSATTPIPDSATTPIPDGTTAPTPDGTTATATKFCVPNPCPPNSKCEERVDGFSCDCLLGLFYNNVSGVCEAANVLVAAMRFPNMPFEDGMLDKTSVLFSETASDITEFLREALGNTTGYIDSIVLSLRRGSVVADVENVYSQSADISVTDIKTAIEKHVEDEPDNTNFAGVGITEPTGCKEGVCDPLTSKCVINGGRYDCECLSGYFKTDFTPNGCVACPSGQEYVDGNCEDCSFGFSGLNCDEPYLLIVVVVASILGGLLVITLGVTIGLSCSKSKKGSKSTDGKDFKGSASNFPFPKIPRLQTNNDWSHGNLEMTESGSTRALVSNGYGNEEIGNDYGDYSFHNSNFQNQKSPGHSYLRRGVGNPYYQQD